MYSKKMIMIVLSIVLMSWTTTTTTTKAQITNGGKCIDALLPCQSSLGSPKPSKECCIPLKKVVQTDLPCLCSLFGNPALTGSINMTQAVQLPVDCGIKNAGPNMCMSGGMTSPPTSSPGPTSAVPTPPAASTPSATPSSPASSPSTDEPPPSGNRAEKNIALAGPVSGLMLLVAGFMFC